MSNVFSSLNKGTDITKGLKKVTNDMKSKNRKDKTSVVPASASSGKSSSSSASKQKDEKTRPPQFGLDGSKWTVSYQIGNKSVAITDTEPRQTIYIYKCKDSVVQVKGKVNAITLDDCSKTAVVFENVVASFDIVNCHSVEVQVTGKVPSFAIDKTSGCQIYLSKDALDTEIVTSKSSEMNVLIPPPKADDDMIEVAIPEQFKTIIKDRKLVTESVAHV